MVVARANEAANGGYSIRTLTVLDDHRLTPSFRQPVCEQPTDQVRRNARWQRNDHADRALRPRLGVGWSSRQDQRGQGRDGQGTCHSFDPWHVILATVCQMMLLA